MKTIRLLWITAILTLSGNALLAQGAGCNNPIVVTSTEPFFEDFEGGGLPACWTQSGTYWDWTVGTGDYASTPGYSGGIYYQGAFSGIFNAVITHHQSTFRGNSTKLITPLLDLSALSGCQLVFHQLRRSWVGDIDTLRIFYRVSDTSAWQLLATYTAEAPVWTETVVALPNPSSTYQVAFGYSDAWGYGCGIDDVYIGGAQGCARVTGLTATNVGDDSVTLAWHDDVNYSATYAVTWWSDAGDTLSATATDTTFVVDQLSPGTMYHFSVETECFDASLSLPVRLSLRTALGVVHIPYAEHFECLPTIQLPSGWSLLDGTFGIQRYGSMGNRLKFVSPVAIALPPFDQPTGNLEMQFFLSTNTSVYPSSFSVGYMTDLSDSTTYVNVASWANYECTVDEVKTAIFLGAPDSARIVIRVDSTNAYAWYFDNLLVDFIQECPPPIAITVDSVTGTTLSISISGLESSYRVWWTDGTTVDSTDVYDTVYTVTGLDALTYYTVSAAGFCIDGGLTSAISIRARTGCGSMPVPYVEDFSSYSSGEVPECWTVLQGTPYVYNDYDMSLRDSSSFLRFVVHNAAIALPQMSMPADSLQVTFLLRPRNAADDTGGTFSVGYMTNLADNSTFVAVETWRCGELNDHVFVLAEVLMTGAPDSAYIVFRQNVVGANVRWEVDSVVVERVTSCLQPSHLTVVNVGDTSVTVSVVGGNSGNYQLYITDGVAYSDTVFIPIVRSYTFTGLSPLTTYTITAVSDCGNDVSNPVAVTATTLEPLDTASCSVPYSTGFEPGDNVGWLWISSSGTDKWAIGSATASSGIRSMYISADNGVSNQHSFQNNVNAYAYKTFWFDAGREYYISYDWRIGNCGIGRVALAPVSVEVNASYQLPPNGVPAGWISLDGDGPLNYGEAWHSRSCFFTVETSGFYRLFFNWNSSWRSYEQPPLAIDNVCIIPITCPEVLNLMADSVGMDNATLSWMPGGRERMWEVSVGGGTAIVGTCCYHVDNLQSLTAYTASVRPICGTGDTGLAVTCTFTTNACNDALEHRNFTATQSVLYANELPFCPTAYGHGYSQMIIPASSLNPYGRRIHALSLKLHGGSSISVVVHGMDVYMANVSEDNLTSGFVHPDSAHQFHRVIADADFVYGGQSEVHTFDTVFHWDGYSNILVAFMRDEDVDANYNDYPSYESHTDNARRVCDVTSYYPIDINSVAGGTVHPVTPNVMLYSCPGGCLEPHVDDVVADGENVMIRFSSDDTVEVCISEGGWDDGASGIILPPTVNSYTFTGLTAMRQYYVGIRKWCDVGSVSEWVISSVVTLDMGCLPPTSFTLGNTYFTSQQFEWAHAGDETAWQLRIFNAFTNIVQPCHLTSATITDLYPGTTYYTTIRSLCGIDGDMPGPWGDTLTFTTRDCPPVTGVSVGNISATEATVSWEPVSGSVGYRIYYGYEDFYDAEATVVDLAATATSYTMTGLDGSTPYEVYILNRCSSSVYSGVAEGQRVPFTTAVGIDRWPQATDFWPLLYPNPASDHVTLTTNCLEGSVQIVIVDINGRVRGEWRVESGECRVDVSGLTPGAYFVKVTGVNMTVVEKLMVR